MYLEFLKITAPIVFNQRFEPGTLGSEYQCSSTAPSWDLYVRSGDNALTGQYSIVCYRPILPDGLLWLVDHG